MNADQFQASLRDPQARVPAGLLNPDGQAAAKRFDVYRNNVAVSLTEALITGFPVLYKLVGDAFFRALAGVFLRQHPPSTPLMMHYGDALPAFLRHFPPAQGLPYLPDVAALELAMRRAYHAADATPIDAQALAAIAPDALMAVGLKIAPAVQVITSDYPIHAIYLANTQDNAPQPQMQPQSVLITRPGFDPVLHPIPANAATCIAALQAGQTLGQMLAKTDERFDLGATLGLLLAQGAVTAIDRKGP